MKKLFFLCFLLLFTCKTNAMDMFTLPMNDNIFYESGQNLNEYLIYTPDKRCLLHYLSPFSPPSDWAIQITKKSDLKDVECLDKGFASVNIEDNDGNLIQTLNGYFLNGFFIGATPLNSHAIKRSAKTDGTQNLFYFIDKDEELNVQYIGKMNAYLINNVYTSFETCSPFEVLVQTPNKALFKENDTIQNLFTVVKSYAQTLCPQLENIIFLATDSPSLDDSGIFFKEVLRKDEISELWIAVSSKSFNDVVKPRKKKDEKTVISSVAISAEKERAFEEKNTQNEASVDGEYIVHVSSKTNNRTLFIDKPYLMKAAQTEITLTLKSGWYKVKAILTPMEDLEKKRTGISLNEKAAIIEIISATTCDNPNCD